VVFKFKAFRRASIQVYAFEQMEKGDWQNPTLMRPFEGRGKLIHVDEGGKAAVELVALPPS